ncbi:MAG TPA: hypothetical protein VMN99_16020 [Anaerolineales bacterium]|nr:hypothetical protein [Anaerolineales bacterium]
MRRQSKKKAETNRRLDPMIIVALIGLAGTIIAALLASPLLEKWFSQQPAATDSSQSPSNTAVASPQILGNHIGLNQTVTGTLYQAEAGVWIFSEGPAPVTIILDVGPFGSALLIVRDPSGVDRAYVEEQQSPGVARLVNFFIPTEGDYTILVRNAANEQVDYTLTVQDALTPPPP